MTDELPGRLTTRRLLLRTPHPDDAEPLNTAILESFTELNAWVPWAVSPPSVADTRAFCETSQTQRAEGTACALLMLDGADGTVVGATGYPRLDRTVPSFEIGYWCRTPLCGRGFATEVTEALTRHAFDVLGARRVELRIDDRNLRSAAVAERLGFALEGVLRRNVRDHHGRVCDTRVYSLISLDGLIQPR